MTWSFAYLQPFLPYFLGLIFKIRVNEQMTFRAHSLSTTEAATMTPTLDTMEDLPSGDMMYIGDPMNSMDFELSTDLGPEIFSTDAEALHFPTPLDEPAQRNVSDSSVSESKSIVVSSEDPVTAGFLTGRPPIQLYLSCDDTVMSPYQILARRQIEFFEANLDDIESNAQGRNKPIVLGQVGIRCRHCNHLPPKQRKRGAVYYPAKLEGVYQAAHNMALSHFSTYCESMDESLRKNLIYLRENKTTTGGGKSAWAERAGALCIFEDAHGLRFFPKLQYREECERLEI
jgi:hypothetical protein